VLDASQVGTNTGPCVNIYAPAWQVNVAHFASATSYRAIDPGNPFSTAATISNGTSFAAPLVAGVIARILEKEPYLTVPEIAIRLTEMADHTGAPFNGLDWYWQYVDRVPHLDPSY